MFIEAGFAFLPSSLSNQQDFMKHVCQSIGVNYNSPFRLRSTGQKACSPRPYHLLGETEDIVYYNMKTTKNNTENLFPRLY